MNPPALGAGIAESDPQNLDCWLMFWVIKDLWVEGSNPSRDRKVPVAQSGRATEAFPKAQTCQQLFQDGWNGSITQVVCSL
mgnify:CR=1 FL=1